MVVAVGVGRQWSQIFLTLRVPSFSELSSHDIWGVVPLSLGFCEVPAL